MKLLQASALFAVAYSACLSDEQLIKDNEGEVNFKPDTNSRTVCWGGNADDLKHYLGLDYDQMAKTGQVISVADCNKMFNLKVADARAIADKIFGKSKPDCSCARATVVDVIYDMSPANDLASPPALAQVELDGWKVSMTSNYYVNWEADPTLDESAYDWLYAHHWCWESNARCSNDLQQVKNNKCRAIQDGS